MTRTLIGSAILAFLVGAACSAPSGIDFTGSSGTAGNSGRGGGTTGTSTGGSTGTGTIGGDSGLPCDVSAILSAHCISCHGNPPTANAIGTMLTYAELTAASVESPGMSVAALALQRMQATTAPMPPKPIAAVSAAEIASWAAWVNGGLKTGTCGGVDAGPPDTTFTGPSVCASGQTYNLGNDGDSSMYPGQACIACHSMGEGPHFSAAGTVFDTGHVPNDCLPTAAAMADLTQATVVIHDANGTDHTLKVNSNGNFSSGKNGGTIATPYTAKVVYMGKERAMATPQTSGDCNSCHTDKGTTTIPGGTVAPGRVALPVYP